MEVSSIDRSLVVVHTHHHLVMYIICHSVLVILVENANYLVVPQFSLIFKKVWFQGHYFFPFWAHYVLYTFPFSIILFNFDMILKFSTLFVPPTFHPTLPNSAAQNKHHSSQQSSNGIFKLTGFRARLWLSRSILKSHLQNWNYFWERKDVTSSFWWA